MLFFFGLKFFADGKIKIEIYRAVNFNNRYFVYHLHVRKGVKRGLPLTLVDLEFDPARHGCQAYIVHTSVL